jgi:hypothetical protein
MKTVLQIIEEPVGEQMRSAFRSRTSRGCGLIEVLPERGPDGRTVVSVAHYGEQNSDAMQRPGNVVRVVEEEEQTGGFLAVLLPE